MRSDGNLLCESSGHSRVSRPPVQEHEEDRCGERSRRRHQPDLHAGGRESEPDVESAPSSLVQELRPIRPRIVIGSPRLRGGEVRVGSQDGANQGTRQRIRDCSEHGGARVAVDEGTATVNLE
jgi:hypothetical protein